MERVLMKILWGFFFFQIFQGYFRDFVEKVFGVKEYVGVNESIVLFLSIQESKFFYFESKYLLF